MIFVVSGEGPSDIGDCERGEIECTGRSFKPGPMAMVIDRIVDQKTDGGLSPLAASAIEFISKRALCAVEVSGSMLLATGKKSKAGTALFTRNAQQLAVFARRFGADNSPVAAILFRDADGTRSTERGLYEAKRDSILRGFASVGFELGVPMVPKPKSEAWLLCALKENPYQHCSALEDSLSGNDNAPDSAKEQLEQRLGALGKTNGDLVPMLTAGEIAVDRIIMPSFQKFRERLEEVTDRMLGRRSP